MAEPGGGEVPQISRSETSKPSETRRIFDTLKAGITGKISPKEVFRKILNVTTETNLTAGSSVPVIETVVSEPIVEPEKVLDLHDASVKKIDRYLETTKTDKSKTLFLKERLTEVNSGGERFRKLIGKNPIDKMYFAKYRREAVAKLSQEGINDADTLVKMMEEMGSHLLIFGRNKNKMVKNENGRKVREDIWVDHIDYGRLSWDTGATEKLVEMNQRLGDVRKVGAAIRIGEVLGLVRYKFSESTNLLITLGNLPEAKVNEVIDRLKEFSCISYNSLESVEAKKRFGELVTKFIEDPNYFQGVIDNLEDAERLYQLDRFHTNTVKLEDLDRGGIDSRILTVIGNILPEDPKNVDFNISGTIHVLHREPELTTGIIKLIDSGFTVDKETVKQINGWSIKEKLIPKITAAVELLSFDEDGDGLVKSLSDFLGVKDFDGLFHITEIASKIKTRISENTDGNQDRADTIKSEIGDYLSKDSKFANQIFTGREDLLFALAKNFNRSALMSIVPSVYKTFPEESSEFWKFYLESNSGHLHDFLLDHYHDFGQLFSSGLPTTDGVRTLIESYDQGSSSYLFSKYYNGYNLESLPPEYQVVLSLIMVKINVYDTKEIQNLWENRSVLLEKYLSDGKLNQQFYEDIARLKPSFVVEFLTESELGSMSVEDRRFWVTFKNIDTQAQLGILELKDNFNQFLDADGSYRPEFVRWLEEHKYLKGVDSILNDELIDKFSASEKSFWQVFKKAPEETKATLYSDKNKILALIESSSDPEKATQQLLQLLEKIADSPSREVQKLKYQIIGEVFKSNDPVGDFQKIEQIFIKNNLPIAGKILKVFNVLYPPVVIKQMLDRNPRLSPVLKATESSRRRIDIMYRDILSIHLRSDNLTLKNYLKIISQGGALADRYSNGEKLSEREMLLLGHFTAKINTLYQNSLLSRTQPKPIQVVDIDMKKTLVELRTSLKVKPGQSFQDRVTEMFLKPVGISSLEEALSLMSKTKHEAETRNLILAAQPDGIKLNQGDLVKGVDFQYLENILQNGSVAKEFLGESAGSDYTPFDTDCSMVQNESDSFNGTLKGLLANGYGNMLLIVKDRGQFQKTEPGQSVIYEPGKYELFAAQGAESDHHGIRTGFPSTEIDGMVLTGNLLKDSKLKENVFFTIAKQGLYIPVVDDNGVIIFSPEMYQQYRHAFDGVSLYDGDSIVIDRMAETNALYAAMVEAKKDLAVTREKTTEMNIQIRQKIEEVLTQFGVKLKDEFDTGLLGAELHDIGSSGRGTNMPGDFDFDYTLLLDAIDSKRKSEINAALRQAFTFEEDNGSNNTGEHDQIRMAGVELSTGEKIDVDIGISSKNQAFVFGSHDAISQKLAFIKEKDGQVVYEEVVANILLAKQILKESHAYKKGGYGDGGLGGIGVENWILANGGNIDRAFKTFWEIAHENGEIVPLEKFKQKYPILDAGMNLKFGMTHDNFVQLLTESGYQQMLATIQKYIS